MNKKKDGDTIQLREDLYAVNFFIRKLFFNDLISRSSHWDPAGAYSYISTASSAWGLNLILRLRMGLEFGLDQA